MKKYITILLICIITFGLTGCFKNVEPKSEIDKYMFNKAIEGKGEEVKIPVQEVFQVNECLYRVKIPMEEKDGLIPSYDIGVTSSGYNGEFYVFYKATEPAVYYTDETEPYILVKCNEKDRVNNNDTDYIHIINVKIVVPKHSLESSPNDLGKFGVQENVKLN
jgi:hypothetical protein